MDDSIDGVERAGVRCRQRQNHDQPSPRSEAEGSLDANQVAIRAAAEHLAHDLDATDTLSVYLDGQCIDGLSAEEANKIRKEAQGALASDAERARGGATIAQETLRRIAE